VLQTCCRYWFELAARSVADATSNGTRAEPDLKAALTHRFFSVAALDVHLLPDSDGSKMAP